jgi:GST-like protein
MVDLYTWPTPNGRKVSIMLEETGIPYRVVPVNLGREEQKTPEFTRINPNQRIPAIVDHDAPGGPLSVFESGAILVYLAEKSGKFLPTDVRARSQVVQWLMFQMGGVGPMIGQAGWFINQAEEKIPYAIQRYVNESARLVEVLESALRDRDFLGGDYSIADMASYPWIKAAWGPFAQMMPDRVGKCGHVAAWLDRIAARPAVERGMQVPAV